MRRVAVTGIGAVTPLGLDAPGTWRAALAGESGIDWISTFDTDGLPVRIAGRGEGLRPDAGRPGKGGADELERNVLLRRRGRSRGAGGRRAERLRPDARRDRVRIGDRRRPRHPRAGRHAARARAGPRLPELPAERARRLRLRTARDLARHQGPELRGRLRLRNGLARRRRGRRDDQAWRGRRGARRRHRVLPRAADPRRLHRDARARRRGRATRRARPGRSTRRGPASSWRRVPARSCSRTGRRPSGAAPRSTPRCSATAPRTTRITWRSPSPRRRASRR